jgi:hypothetical protein
MALFEGCDILASIGSWLGDAGPRHRPAVVTAVVGIAADDLPTVGSTGGAGSMPEDQ